jgi:hypothetical protein
MEDMPLQENGRPFGPAIFFPIFFWNTAPISAMNGPAYLLL